MLSENNLTVTPLEELIARKKRRERKHEKVISSGWKSNTLNLVCLVAAVLLCFAHFEHLQADADYKIFEVQNVSIFLLRKDFLAGVVRHGHIISAVMLLLHVVAIKLSKTRFTFLGLLSVLSWPALFFVHYEQIHHRDYLISRLALSAFTLLISTAILFLPKKPKRKKRPNTFYSAFSVASTPLSQRSHFTQSQCSSVLNFGLDNPKDRVMDLGDDVQSLSSKTLRFGTSTGIRNRTFLNKPKLVNCDANAFGTLKSGSQKPTSLFPTKSFGWREKREETPLREVNQLIDDLMLYSTDEDTENEPDDGVIGRQSEVGMDGTLSMMETPPKNESQMMLSARAISPGRQRRHAKQQGPFASLTFNPAVRKIASSCSSRSLFGPNTVLSASISRAGSSCSSLSNSNTSSSPFRHL